MSTTDDLASTQIYAWSKVLSIVAVQWERDISKLLWLHDSLTLGSVKPVARRILDDYIQGGRDWTDDLTEVRSVEARLASELSPDVVTALRRCAAVLAIPERDFDMTVQWMDVVSDLMASGQHPSQDGVIALLIHQARRALKQGDLLLSREVATPVWDDWSLQLRWTSVFPADPSLNLTDFSLLRQAAVVLRLVVAMPREQQAVLVAWMRSEALKVGAEPSTVYIPPVPNTVASESS